LALCWNADAVAGTRALRAGKPAAHLQVDTSSLRILHGVQLGSRGTPPGSTALALMMTDGKGGMLNLHQAPPSVGPDGKLEAHPNPTYLAVPKSSDGKSRAAKQGQPMTPAIAGKVLPALERALRSAPGHSEGAIIGQHFVGHLERVSNQGLGSHADQQANLSAHSTLFDEGQHSLAAERLAPYAGSGFKQVRMGANFLLGEVHSLLGDHQTAIAAFEDALLHAPAGLEAMIRGRLADTYRGLRQFDKAIEQASLAVDLSKRVKAAGGNADVSASLFTLAVMQKNHGLIEEAATNMQAALAERPEHVSTRIAAASYLALAGKPAEADHLFGAIPVPAAGSQASINYAMNATWFHALKSDRGAVVAFAKTALATAAQHQMLPSVVQYFKTEVDLDKYRGDAAFAQVLDSYAARIN